MNPLSQSNLNGRAENTGNKKIRIKLAECLEPRTPNSKDECRLETGARGISPEAVPIQDFGPAAYRPRP